MQTNLYMESSRDQRIELSRDARVRMQQRGINPFELSLIRQFGTRTHDGHGALRYLFDKNAARRCARTLGDVVRTESLRGLYIVEAIVDDDSLPVVLTASQRR